MQPGELLHYLPMLCDELVVALHQTLLQVKILVSQKFTNIVELLVEFQQNLVQRVLQQVKVG